MDIISIEDMDKSFIESIFDRADYLEKRLKNHEPVKSLEGYVVATLFFEPSTRTKLSFQAAACRAGAAYIDFISEKSSLKKGESLKDTLRTVEQYCDCIVLRHRYEGAARFAAEVCDAPIINGGDGANQHPTQALLDLYTIKKMKHGIKNKVVQLYGDLKNARTMHSLLYGLALFGADIILTSPAGLEMDQRLVKEIEQTFDIEIEQRTFIDFSNTDVLYMCRIQKERFSDPLQASLVTTEFRLTPDLLRNASSDMIILHPLPKIDEVDPAVDDDPRAKYFDQVANGIPIRMALLETVLGVVE